MNKPFFDDSRWDMRELKLPKRIEKLITGAQDAVREMRSDLIEAANECRISLADAEPQLSRPRRLIDRYLKVKDNVRVLESEMSRIQHWRGYAKKDKPVIEKSIHMAVALTRRELEAFVEGYIQDMGMSMVDLQWITSILDETDAEKLFTRLNVIYKTLSPFMREHAYRVASLHACTKN